MKVKSWKMLGTSKVLAESYGRSLVVETYLDPVTEKPREYSKFHGNVFSSIILAVTTKNEVLAVRQFRPAVSGVTLELPGGSQKHRDQIPESVAKEEFSEETSGYQPGRVIPLLEKGCWFEPSSVDIIFYPYLFLDCTQTNMATETDDGEYVELVKIPLPEWLIMCETGQIQDSKSIVVTALARRHLQMEGRI